MLLVARPGDDAADGRMIENPSQSQVTHADPFRNHLPDLLHRLKRSLKIDARERFSTIKLLTMSVEIPVIVRGERGVAIDFPG